MLSLLYIGATSGQFARDATAVTAVIKYITLPVNNNVDYTTINF